MPHRLVYLNNSSFSKDIPSRLINTPDRLSTVLHFVPVEPPPYQYAENMSPLTGKPTVEPNAQELALAEPGVPLSRFAKEPRDFPKISQAMEAPKTNGSPDSQKTVVGSEDNPIREHDNPDLHLATSIKCTELEPLQLASTESFPESHPLTLGSRSIEGTSQGSDFQIISSGKSAGEHADRDQGTTPQTTPPQTPRSKSVKRSRSTRSTPESHSSKRHQISAPDAANADQETEPKKAKTGSCTTAEDTARLKNVIGLPKPVTSPSKTTSPSKSTKRSKKVGPEDTSKPSVRTPRSRGPKRQPPEALVPGRRSSRISSAKAVAKAEGTKSAMIPVSVPNGVQSPRRGTVQGRAPKADIALQKNGHRPPISTPGADKKASYLEPEALQRIPFTSSGTNGPRALLPLGALNQKVASLDATSTAKWELLSSLKLELESMKHELSKQNRLISAMKQEIQDLSNSQRTQADHVQTVEQETSEVKNQILMMIHKLKLERERWIQNEGDLLALKGERSGYIQPDLEERLAQVEKQLKLVAGDGFFEAVSEL